MKLFREQYGGSTSFECELYCVKQDDLCIYDRRATNAFKNIADDDHQHQVTVQLTAELISIIRALITNSPHGAAYVIVRPALARNPNKWKTRHFQNGRIRHPTENRLGCLNEIDNR